MSFGENPKKGISEPAPWSGGDHEVIRYEVTGIKEVKIRLDGEDLSFKDLGYIAADVERFRTFEVIVGEDRFRACFECVSEEGFAFKTNQIKLKKSRRKEYYKYFTIFKGGQSEFVADFG